MSYTMFEQFYYHDSTIGKMRQFLKFKIWLNLINQGIWLCYNAYLYVNIFEASYLPFYVQYGKSFDTS